MSSTGEERLFQIVEDVLTRHLHQSDAASYLDEIKQKYLEQHFRKVSTQGLSRHIAACRTCDSPTSLPNEGKWNLVDPDILMIVDNVDRYKENISALIPLLKSAGISSSFFGLTGLVKCTFQKYSQDHINNCSSYIYDQLDSIRPKAVIVSSKSTFELFQTQQKNFTAAINTSWWWGVYKIFCLDSLGKYDPEIMGPQYLDVFRSVHAFVYGMNLETLLIDGTD